MIGYANGDELDNMLDDRTAVLSPGKTSFHTVPVYRLIRAALAQPSPAGEYGDAYQGAREDIAIWKRRALEAEQALRQAHNGQTFMGEPLVQPYEAPREKVNALFKVLGFSGTASVGDILDAALERLQAQPSPALPPFAEKVLAKLRRFYDCASDFESGGVDIGRHWLDLLTQLGLLNRVQRSPALWEISQQGEDLLGMPQPSPAQAEQHWQKLEKPAQVGAIRFRAGLSSRLVVEAAQRLYEFESTPEKEAERIERLQAFREQCFEPLGAEFSKVLSENLVELSSDAKPEQADEKPGDSILCYGCFAKGVGPDHFDEAGKCLAAQAEAERPEVAEVAFVLRNIGAMDAEDIDGDNVDLRFEDAEGRDTGCDVSIVEYAEKAADLFEQHDRIVGELRADRDSWAEQAEQRLADWDEMRKERDAALARVSGLRSLLNPILCYVENDIERMRGDRDKSDNKEIYDLAISLAMERLKAAQHAVFTTEPGCDTAVELASHITAQAQHSV
ncbi:hypothetical protein, partial [Pseudomonas aeruginosa]|uniref:hypothetical protein n=1 Tax=Pseudomonas aeruginosa TaxID=287 RepID=UPI003F7EEDF7